MKTLFRGLVGCIVFLSLLSCGAPKQENDVSENNTTEVQRSAIYLDGIYATSTKLPLSQHSLENIFDGNPQTSWATAVGAASDEGVMLYFSGPTYVKEIKLTAAAGAELASIKAVAVYADGHKVTSADPSSNIKIDETLSSLFIKIEGTDHFDIVKVGDGDDGEQSLERFDSKFSVGLSEIEVFGETEKLELMPPQAITGSVVASSVLTPADAYNAAQLFDSRKEFVWAEGGKGSGENENLTFSLEKEQTVSRIKVWNGYQRSEKHFGANARIKSFEFGIKGGSKATYTLQDSMDPQEVTLNEPLSGKEFVLTVLEVYPGKDYKDLVVSEILFFNTDIPFVVKNNDAEASVKSLITKTKGSVLENYVDKRLKNHVDNYDFISDKSLILRSNKTFVLYEHSTTSDGTKEETVETVADGNWEIMEQTDEYAKVRVFGKLFNLSEAVEVYKGNTSKEFIKIFQDNLHITKEEVRGEKYIDVLFNQPPGEQ